jgi:hypothetical protein
MAKGLFTPRNPEKYLGDPSKIRFLSSWERMFMEFCDKNVNVIKWGSEEFKVPYVHPIKKNADGSPKVCNYIPDFIIKYQDRDGKMLTEVIEIKPHKQTVIGKKVSTYDKVQLVINDAKWRSAKSFCDNHGIKFRVLTEKELFR